MPLHIFLLYSQKKTNQICYESHTIPPPIDKKKSKLRRYMRYIKCFCLGD